jgi:hypothetical protein
LRINNNNQKEKNMKKSFIPAVLVIIGLLFLSSSNSFAQNNRDIGQKLRIQLNKFFDSTGDCQKGSNEALKVRKRLKLHDGIGECKGFVDENGDRQCDNCGGTGECDRIRDQDGKLKKYRGGK